MFMTIKLKNNKFLTDDNNKVIFSFINSTIIDYSDKSINLKSKSLDKIYPSLIKIENEYKLNRSFELTENGIIIEMMFSDKIELKSIIDKRRKYNIECKLYNIQNNRLTFKILKISNGNNYSNDDFPEPDHLDVLEIREAFKRKILNFKNKLDEISISLIDNMSLSELDKMEENLYDFIQNNI